ncbi:UNVERIFIED_CONTAM: hypothetical protein Sradi_6421100 [Sesamum radiatum]|uniref:Uncharacterized protein n=1 Tax=Sesamum radiatum TaxID=300843 RepID=A0AAW2K4Y7_SESRA
MANTTFDEQTKYLDIDCHIIQNQYKLGFVAPSFVCRKEQLSDIFSKSLIGPSFLILSSKLAFFSMVPSPTCGGCVGSLLHQQEDHESLQHRHGPVLARVAQQHLDIG